jgi:hypothetical protein
LEEGKLKCPKCDSSSVAEILWGYYTDVNSLEDALEKKEIVLGGCCVTDNDPKWECNECSHQWGERED